MADHLIISALPTPNGDMHLGHIGGPFLAGDALGRHLRAEGHQVTTLTATDGWESFVLDAAQREGRSPRAAARHYHERTVQALAAVDCAPDLFLDLLDGPLAQDHVRWHHELAERLGAAGLLDVRTERVPVDSENGDHLVGYRLAGSCPVCGAGIAGYNCEGCGTWFQPSDVRDARARTSTGGTAWTQTDSVFLTLDADALLGTARKRDVPDAYVGLLHRYLGFNGPYWRLTHPLGWGVPWTGEPRLSASQVHFSSALGAGATFLVAGQEYARLRGLTRNPLAAPGEPKPRLTLCFGKDCAIPLLMQIALENATGLPVGPDECRFNEFMLLDGAKFSTSRNHVIRVLDYAAAGLDTDALRFHLARRYPKDGPTDFTPQGFADDVERTLVVRLGRFLDRCEAGAHPSPARPPQPGRAGYAEDVARRHRLAFAHGELAAAAGLVDEWLDADEVIDEHGGPAALSFLAALAAPFMPRWADAAWHGLGLTGLPRLDEAFRLLGAAGAAAAPRAPGHGRPAPIPRFEAVPAARVRSLVSEQHG